MENLKQGLMYISSTGQIRYASNYADKQDKSNFTYENEHWVQPISMYRTCERIQAGRPVSIALFEDQDTLQQNSEEPLVIKTNTIKHKKCLGIAINPAEKGEMVHILPFGTFSFDFTNEDTFEDDTPLWYKPDFTNDVDVLDYEHLLGKTLYLNSSILEGNSVDTIITNENTGIFTLDTKNAFSSGGNVIQVGHITDVNIKDGKITNLLVEINLEGDGRGPLEFTQLQTLITKDSMTFPAEHGIRFLSFSTDRKFIAPNDGAGSQELEGNLIYADIQKGYNQAVLGAYSEARPDRVYEVGDNIVVTRVGEVQIPKGGTPLIKGATYYLATNGTITTQEDISADFLLKVGYAKDDKTLVVELGEMRKPYSHVEPLATIKPTTRINDVLEGGYLELDGSTVLNIADYQDLFTKVSSWGWELNATETTFVLPLHNGFMIKYHDSYIPISQEFDEFLTFSGTFPEQLDSSSTQCRVGDSDGEIDITPLIREGYFFKDDATTNNLILNQANLDIKIFVDLKADEATSNDWVEIPKGFHNYNNFISYGFDWRILKDEENSLYKLVCKTSEDSSIGIAYQESPNSPPTLLNSRKWFVLVRKLNQVQDTLNVSELLDRYVLNEISEGSPDNIPVTAKAVIDYNRNPVKDSIVALKELTVGNIVDGIPAEKMEVLSEKIILDTSELSISTDSKEIIILNSETRLFEVTTVDAYWDSKATSNQEIGGVSYDRDVPINSASHWKDFFKPYNKLNKENVEPKDTQIVPFKALVDHSNLTADVESVVNSEFAPHGIIMGIDGTVNARELGGLSLSDKRNSVCKNKKDPLATNRDFDQKDSFIPFVNEGSFSIENNIKYRDEQGDLLCSTTIVKEKETETIVKPKNSLQEVKSLDWNKFYKDFNNNSAKETNKDISNLFALQGLTDKEVLNNLVSKYEKYLLPIKYTLHKNSTLSEASYKVELEITDTDINFKDLNNCPTVLFGDTLEGSFTFENEGVIYKGLISDKNFFLYKATDNSILNVVDSTTWNAFKASYGLSFTKDSTDNRVYTLRNGNLSFKLRLEEATEKGFKLKVISYSNIPSTSFKYTSLFETIGKTFNCTYQEVAFCNSYSLRKLNEDKRFTKVFNNFNTLILEELAPSGSSKLFRFDSFNFEGKVILTTSKGFLGSILFEYSLTGATLFTIEALTLEDWENFDLYKKRILNSFGKAQSFDKVFILTMSREANPQFESENISVEENKIVYSLENCNPLKDFKSSVNYSTADFSLKTIQEHPIYSFIEFPDKKDLLIKSNSKESSLNSYTNLTPMPFDFGGLNKGTTFENEAISSLLDKLLYANISPKSYLTFFDETNALIDSNLINKGKTKQIKKIQVRVEKGSDFVHKVYVYQDLGNNLSKLVGSVLFQKDDYNLESVVKEIVLDTPLTISEEETFFTNVETLLFKDFDSYGDILDDAVPIPNNRNTSFSFKFIEPKFYGYMTVEEVTELRNDTWDWTTINKTYIDASDKEIITLSYSSPDLEFEEDSIQIKEGSSDEISVSYFLAVPKTFTVEKALDENGFDITDSFSMYERLNMNIYTLDFYNVLKDYNIVFKLKGGN